MIDRDHGETRGDRRILFWIFSIIATLLYVFFGAMMLTVPGILRFEKLWMLSIAVISMAASLAVGVWKPGTTDAPMVDSRPAAVMGVIVFLELAHCVSGVIAIAVKQLR